MARRLRTKKDLDAFYAQQELLRSPKTPALLRLQLTGITKRGGYTSTLSRQQRKVTKQLKNVPGCGPKLTDNWGMF